MADHTHTHGRVTPDAAMVPSPRCAPLHKRIAELEGQLAGARVAIDNYVEAAAAGHREITRLTGELTHAKAHNDELKAQLRRLTATPELRRTPPQEAR